jgi:hypothetical protein
VVDPAAGEGDLPAHRADVDDPAVAPLAHPRQQQLRQRQRAQHVGLELAPDGVQRDLLERAHLGVPRVVHQHVDPAVGGDCRRDGSPAAGVVGDVQRQDGAAGRSQLVEGLGTPGGGDGGDAGGSQLQGHGPADAGRAAGDQGDGHGVLPRGEHLSPGESR